jgi:hypothetical protein
MCTSPRLETLARGFAPAKASTAVPTMSTRPQSSMASIRILGDTSNAQTVSKLTLIFVPTLEMLQCLLSSVVFHPDFYVLHHSLTLSDAICGPATPNTPAQDPVTLSGLAALNPCANNFCCTTTGKCGVDNEHCIAGTAVGGNLGSNAINTQDGDAVSCISNCSDDITTGTAPTEFVKIAYYASYAVSRQCLRGLPCNIDPNSYTHAYYASVGWDPTTYAMDVTYSQQPDRDPRIWTLFTQVTGMKKVMSLGGAATPVVPNLLAMWRQATGPDRQTFVTSIYNVRINKSTSWVES